MHSVKAPTKKSQKKTIACRSLQFNIPNPPFPLLTVRRWIKHVAGGICLHECIHQIKNFHAEIVRNCEQQESPLTGDGVGANTSSLNVVAKSMKTHYDLISFPIARFCPQGGQDEWPKLTFTSSTQNTTEDFSSA